MLRAFVNQSDWEQYVPFVLYAYRTAGHSSTGVLSFELMYGRCAHKPSLTMKQGDPVSPNEQECWMLGGKGSGLYHQ